MKITAVRFIQGGSPIPAGGFWPAWWPRQPIYEIGYSICVIETDEGVTGFGPGRVRIGKHGWFNYGRADGSPFHKTMSELEKSLKKLGYLKS